MNQCYEFGRFRVDPVKRVLLRDTKSVPLTPKALDILLALIENNERPLNKDELMRIVWPNTVVEENNLSRNVSTLRKVLGESPNAHEYIVTIPGLGYRFVADVRMATDEQSELVLERRTKSEIIIQEAEEVDLPHSTLVQPSDDELTESKTEATKSFAQYLGSSVKVHRRDILMFVAPLVAVAAGAIFGFFRSPSSRNESRAPLVLPAIETIRLTYSGNCTSAAISPDGKYVVFVNIDRGLQSIWIKQIATGSNLEIVPSADVSYGSITFSRDGNYIYYGMKRNDEETWKLYRMILPGGPATVIREGIWGIALAPDNTQFAYVRDDENRSESILMTANVDGSGERKLAVRKYPDRFRVPAWSPDGRMIACSDGNADTGTPNINLVGVQVQDGSEKAITSDKWPWIGAVAWLSDGKGLLMVARAAGAKSNQIWFLSYPQGEAQKVTNDENYYNNFNLSLTADSRSLVSTQHAYLGSLWIQSTDNPAKGREMTLGAGGYWGLSWAPDGRIVYSSGVSGDFDLWLMEPNATHPRQLTARSGINGSPSVSRDGRYVAFMSDRAGRQNIWTMDLEKGDLRKVTNGNGEDWPRFSPDGRWIVYVSVYSAKPTLWKIAVDGGEPIQLTDTYSTSPAISPDGRLIAYSFRDQRTNSQRIDVMPFEGGPPIKSLVVPSTALKSADIEWMPDGRNLTYIDTRAGISNIWSQSLDGGPARQLTDFRSGQVFFYDWSPDGKQLACSRGVWTQDIVMIRNFANGGQL